MSATLFFSGITTSASFTVLNVQHFFPLTTSWVGEVGWWDHQQTGLSGLQVCELHTHFGMLYLWNKQGGNWKPAGSLLLICFLTARQDVPDRFPGPVDAFGRRTGSGSGHYGEQTKHRSLLDTLLAPKTTVDSDRRRPSSSRNGSTSRKALLSSSRGSGDPSDPIRSSHLVPTSSGSSRPSTNQRLHQSTGLEGRTSSLSKHGRVVHDDPTMRNFERLTISADRRKWNFY